MSARNRPWVLVGCTGLALAVLFSVLRLGGGAPVPAPAGLPDPGAVTGWGLPTVRLLVDLLGLAAVGAAVVPVLTMRRLRDDLSGPGLRAVFTLRPIAAAWAVLTAVELVLTFSDQFAVPVSGVRWGDLSGFARQVDQGQALVVQLVLAGLLALVSRWLITVRESGLLLALAVGALTPPLFTGHSAASGSHDTAVVSLLVHVVAVALWVGGVLALWWHLSGNAESRALAARRFAGLAAWCFALTAVSGVVNALVRLGGLSEFVTSDYGRGALVKLLVLGVLGLVAVRVRAWALGRFAEDVPGCPGWQSLGALTGLELGLMSVAVAIGVALGRTPPPVGEIYTSAAEGLLGGPVPPAPSVGRLLWSWTPSGVGLFVVGLGAAAYVVGVWSLRRRGERWPMPRTASWLAGLVLVGYATLGGLGTYSHVMFSAHMASHMVLSMMAPIMLVLGAPTTLALKALPGGDLPGVQGPRQWLAGALRSRPVRVLSHPVMVAVLFVGSLYAVYFTGLFTALMESHLGHAAMELHFLAVGFLFFEVLVGAAPLATRPAHLGRLLMMLVVMPFHAFFAVAVMSADTVIGGDYYRLLARGFATDLLADQYLAGSMTWALGEVPMVMVLLVLLTQWKRADARTARQHDRRAERDGDAELAAYNRMLAAAAERDQAPNVG